MRRIEKNCTTDSPLLSSKIFSVMEREFVSLVNSASGLRLLQHLWRSFFAAKDDKAQANR